ncbi:MAG: hypothetical protein QY309_11650 [Cyclobacteriaceae bacterium]|nr:MAG: hypothetical protein QY309_11650 [Cyclobacteriaceae bacterium]
MIKVVSRLASLMIVAGALVFLSNCGGDDPKDPAQKVQLEKLSTTWNIVSATLDGTTRTADFTGFTLTISGTFNSNDPDGPYNYSVSGTRPTPSPWPASGQWEFAVLGTGDTGTLLRSDGVDVTYSISSNNQLTLSFACVECDYAGSRVEEVIGDWVFVLD